MRPKPLLVSSAAVTTAAAVGGLATTTGTSWFKGLDRPPWQPPDSVFGPVWTALYAATAVSAAVAWDAQSPHWDRKSRRRNLAAAYGLNLTLNAAWSVLFFRQHRLVLATLDSAALCASTVALAATTRRSSPLAAALLVPYAAWTGFATVLSAEITRRNRG